ncbi:EcsC family protein [uncultured Leuconostoc sp.]|uniref:EcsC family protein n=1 Tax=uncultured Leuconostoc sp. TaxID=173262 RepID=UPI0028045909|nr:EcsC family protein [uncultured Leuconostoc sp.]
MMQTLDWAYEQTMTGLPGQKSIDQLVQDYLTRYDPETAINKLVRSQKTMATTSGILTGLGGILTMPVTIPANVVSVILVQMRMIAAIANIRGYDLKSDQVRTLVYATLAGTSVIDIVKKTGITIGDKLLVGVVQKIPGKSLQKINQAVGFRLVTKFGTKGVINMGKTIPLVGAVVGGSFDYATTSVIAKLAKKNFTNDGVDLGDGTRIDK